MTKEEETNIAVHKIIDPKGCWHEIDYEAVLVYKCKKCGKLGDLVPSDIHNPNYLTADGIAKIREWLEEQWYLKNADDGDETNRWEEFMQFVIIPLAQTYRSDDSINCTTNDGILPKKIKKLVNVFMEPELFIPKFLTYARENNLGG